MEKIGFQLFLLLEKRKNAKKTKNMLKNGHKYDILIKLIKTDGGSWVTGVPPSLQN